MLLSSAFYLAAGPSNMFFNWETPVDSSFTKALFKGPDETLDSSTLSNFLS